MKKINLLVSFLILVAFALACSSSDETEKANKSVDEANVAITDANKNAADGMKKIQEMEAMIPNIKNEEDLKSGRDIAKESISLYEKARDQYKEASNKFGEAGKFKINDKFKEYLDAKSLEMKKRSELMEAIIEEPKALIDSESRKVYQEKVTKILEKSKALKKEVDELETKANKIHEDNKDIFKKS